MNENIKSFFKNAIANKLTPVLLIIAGITGFLTSGIVIYIIAILLIILGIFALIKKLYFVGIISVLFGIIIIVLFKFFNSLTKIVSGLAIILGIILFIIGFIKNKKLKASHTQDNSSFSE